VAFYILSDIETPIKTTNGTRNRNTAGDPTGTFFCAASGSGGMKE
jgi:hypothetical protein